MFILLSICSLDCLSTRGEKSDFLSDFSVPASDLVTGHLDLSLGGLSAGCPGELSPMKDLHLNPFLLAFPTCLRGVLQEEHRTSQPFAQPRGTCVLQARLRNLFGKAL